MRYMMLGAAAAAALICGGSAAMAADAIPYPNAGTENPMIDTFTATSTGDITAYFYGNGGASYTETLGLLVNGVDTGSTGLNNHSSSEGDSYDFGQVTAGSSLTFYINVNDGVDQPFNLYSTAALNPGGTNQVYSTTYSGGVPSGGGVAIPAGTYVGFEDENPTIHGSSNFNYADEQFVFTNTTVATSATPEPASWAMMILGLGGIGLAFRQAKRRHGFRFSDAFAA